MRAATMRGGVSFGAAAFVLSAGGFVPRARAGNPVFDFRPVPANTLDTVTLPDGFSWRVLVAWGDPLWSEGVPFDPATRGTARSQSLAFGDNNDGMELFEDRGRTILCVNHEYVNKQVIFGNRASGLPETDDDVIKGMAAHGVAVVEVRDGARRAGPVRVRDVLELVVHAVEADLSFDGREARLDGVERFFAGRQAVA